MIKLFRDMRKGLLAKNKLLQYLVYAFGEIILVIAGILIALAINNRSELAKKDEQIASIMKQIREDLLNDILRTNGLIEYYHRKDSLMNLVLFDQLKREDYENPENRVLFQLSTTVTEFLIDDKGYQSLIRNIDNLPPRYTPLMGNLNQVYINNKTLVEQFNKSISDVTDGILKNWQDNFEWYAGLMTGTAIEEVIDYYVEDPFYKNHVTTYSVIAIQNHLPSIENYRVQAIDSYLAISDLLELEHDPEKVKGFMIPENELKILEGTYGTEAFSIQVKLNEAGKLTVQATGQGSLELYPLSAQRFSSRGIPFILEFKVDEKEASTGITLYQGSGAIVLQKN